MIDQLRRLYSRNRKTSVYTFKNNPESNSEIDFKIRRYSSCHNVTNSESEDDLNTNRRSLSCECIFKSLEDTYSAKRSPTNNPEDCEITTETCYGVSKSQETEFQAAEKHLTRKILRKRLKKTVVTKRTFSFFKKILLKPKSSNYFKSETRKHFITEQVNF